MDDLYREFVLDLYRNPLHKKVLDEATHQHRGHNPHCGDDITVYLIVQDGVVREVSFEGVGCALCVAGASLTAENLRGLTEQEARTVSAQQVYDWIGIEMEPTRIKCVTLALRTVQEMLD